jgi:acyl carrier protein
VLDDGVLLQQSWQRFEKVLRPKIEGAAHLHRLTRDDDLDFFILFSSIASLLGSPGQSNYAAANAYLDALAHQRRNAGLPGLSINWGPWDEVGMAAQDGAQERRSSRGMWPIPPEQGLQTLALLLNAPAPQVAVMSVRWPAFLRQYPQTPPLLQAFGRPMQPDSPSVERGPSDIVQQLQAAAPDDRLDMMIAFLREQVQHILGLPSIDQVDAYTALSEMGMDSLMAVELKNALDAAVGKNLPTTIAFEYPTIDAIAGYLVKDVLSFSPDHPDSEEMAETTFNQSGRVKDHDEFASIDLDDLSEEELEALLMEKLDDLDDLEDI